MRLIDADHLKQRIAAGALVAKTQKAAELASKLCDLIDIEPTSYDVDKVVEQLEEECANSARMLNEHRGTGFEFAQQVRYDSYKKALEIVKGGGVNE